MDYFFHSYPKELARRMVSRWGPPSDAFDTLPPEEALASLMSEALQASLLREEDRSVICRVILIDPIELRNEVGPPNGLHVLKFREERQLHEEEIRRLSPTATF